MAASEGFNLRARCQRTAVLETSGSYRAGSLQVCLKPLRAKAALVLGSLAVTVLGACSDSNSAKRSDPPPPSVTVSEPLRQTVTEWDEFTGRFQAIDRVLVQPRVSGYLQSAHFQEGTIVKKGDLLFVIDPRPYEAAAEAAQGQLQTAEAQLTFTARDLERAVELSRTQVVSQQVLDQRRQALQTAEAAVIMAKAALKRAKLDVEFTQVVSPIDGRVGRKLVTEGNLITGGNPGTTVLTRIVSLNPIYFYFNIDELTYLKHTRLRLADRPPTSQDSTNPVRVALPDDTGFPHEGRMDWIDNELDQGTGTLRGRAIVPNPELRFSPGQFGRVQLMGSAPYEALLLPDTAIGSDQSRKFVYVVGKDNVVEMREVRLGRLIEGLRVVREGIRADERVVISGLQRVREGAPVTPRYKAIGETTGGGARP
jgi:membrane fusion protein, multidrug efflux system